jgi:malonyl-CoA/methylmalonyl-CoA synthetase
VEGFVARVAAHGSRRAIVDPAGVWTYDDLARDSASTAAELGPLAGERVALLCAPGHDFVTALLASWRAGALAVPLHPAHPDAELAYFVEDSDARVIVTSPEHAEACRRLASRNGAREVTVTRHASASSTRAPSSDASDMSVATSPAMMVYTSGTTGRPKGVVHSHASVLAMVRGLVDAWAWSADDRILLVLPLHHVHGIVNVTLCALWSGATCEAPGRFDARASWERLASGELTLFMAVPTIYTRLIAAWDAATDADRTRWSAGAARTRLMVSGSAALPVSTLERWHAIAGHVLLERYGMTEIGMALSNTLDHRVAGTVGVPLPGVDVRVVDDDGCVVGEGEPGELLVRGPQLFTEYWHRPDETAAAFTDGWFRTGDVTVHGADGYRLLGRASVDIIKTGGEKVSALDVEEVLRTHPAIGDCAVVGVPDDEWGERVCVAVQLAPDAALDVDDLRVWSKQRLAAPKVPSRVVFVAELPRNTMGKVTKPDVAKLFT